jgi:hypothetical protein
MKTKEEDELDQARKLSLITEPGTVSQEELFNSLGDEKEKVIADLARVNQELER